MTIAPSVRQRSQDCVEDPVEVLAHVFGQETKHEVAVFLQQGVFASVTTVGVRIRQMLRTVQFDRYSTIGI